MAKRHDDVVYTGGIPGGRLVARVRVVEGQNQLVKNPTDPTPEPLFQEGDTFRFAQGHDHRITRIERVSVPPVVDNLVYFYE